MWLVVAGIVLAIVAVTATLVLVAARRPNTAVTGANAADGAAGVAEADGSAEVVETDLTGPCYDGTAAQFMAAWPGFASFGAPWEALKTVVHTDANIATLTYAFAAPSSLYMTFEDHADASGTPLTADQMKQQVIAGLRDISALFAAAFPGKAIRWMDTGSASTAQVVFGMIDMEETRTLAYAYGNSDDGVDGAGYDSDIMFNSRIDWRLDGSGVGYSLRYTTVHELLHALGFGHHTHSASVMYPVATTAYSVASKFPSGVAASNYDKAAMYAVYCE